MIEGYKLTVSFAGADVSALPPAYSDLIDSIAAQGSYPWLFSMYPSIVFEEACKNGAQQYMLKRTTANDVIKTSMQHGKQQNKLTYLTLSRGCLLL